MNEKHTGLLQNANSGARGRVSNKAQGSEFGPQKTYEKARSFCVVTTWQRGRQVTP